ncbi:Hypothetical protein NGAL_HAMBI1146_58450 [Neorhizobium galegae bv. officinalis]|nr:Hypothetical protein NGAL_HAMBI1146_58450 [Neorhizobium galegae bv. officinalis]
MSEPALNAMIANFTVLEQLVINLTHLVTREYDDTRSTRMALVDDIRSRLETVQRVPARDTQRLACMALEHLDRIEPRILGDAGRQPTQ